MICSSCGTGVPHVIETAEEKLLRQVQAVRRIIGNPPAPPLIPSVWEDGPVQTTGPGPTGVSGLTEQSKMVDYPNAAEIAAMYQAALAAYEARFDKLLAQLQESEK